jgi:ATP-dependent RNA helicase DeaD
VRDPSYNCPTTALEDCALIPMSEIESIPESDPCQAAVPESGPPGSQEITPVAPPAPSDEAEPEAPSGFASLGLSASILEVIREVGYEVPSPIQERTIPSLLAGRDVLGQAQTGTGKTAAFALPILDRIDLELRAPQVLVLVPTRELAIQVAEAFQRYASHLDDFHVLPIYGGQAYPIQLRPLARGVHVVVGTPGRLMDHMRRGTINLDNLGHIVLDEADEMLRMGFLEDVNWILERAPKERQVALFSATLPSAIRSIARDHLNDPEEIRVQVRVSAAETIRQRFQIVSGRNKLDALTRLLEVEVFDGMIVFVRTKIQTAELSEKLEARGLASAPLNGDIPQKQREATIDRLKKGRLDILVATDVAARGLDVERVSHVINFDMPIDTEAYVHRIGRTGRAGRLGEAVLFVTPREKRMLRLIERVTDARLEELTLPTTDEINAQRIARFKARIQETLSDERVAFFSKLMEEFLAEADASPQMVCAALALMAQGDQPLLVQDRPEPSRDERPEGGRDDRGQGEFHRGDSQRHARPERGDQPPEAGMERYRLEVGRKHGVQPGHIVGAIANEAELDGREIGRINIFEFFTTVDLPEAMPREIFSLLQTTEVCGQKLRLSKDRGRPERHSGGFGGGRRGGFGGGRRGSFRGRRGRGRY